MDVTCVDQSRGLTLVAKASHHDALGERILHDLAILLAEAFLFDETGHTRCLSVLRLLSPFLRSEWDVAIGLGDLALVRPSRRSVLTVAYGLAFDVVQVIDVTQQRDTAEDGCHECADHDQHRNA